jgi:hypothetical protein
MVVLHEAKLGAVRPRLVARETLEYARKQNQDSREGEGGSNEFEMAEEVLDFSMRDTSEGGLFNDLDDGFATNPVSAVAKTTSPANFLKAATLWKYVPRHWLQK